ncbi:unnamed protein product [Phytomonas sp. EM1]|nr:unnamed protein product [Phytomonas sp. EM1]|eukprot:CCW65529.1 unnamed protein product [Phytomonas sp. isolate EM1]
MLRRGCTFRKIAWRAVPDHTHYDVCVIGGGPGGIAAALRAVDFQKKVCLIECNRLGGHDLWGGTLHSKTLWEFSSGLSKARGAAARRLYGVSLESHLRLDEARMRASMDEVSCTREAQIATALKASDVRFVTGHARFVSNHEVLCHGKGLGPEEAPTAFRRITADYFVIATGSTPRRHPAVPTDGRLVVTSDHVMRLPLPRRLVIVGAGVLGCEFASILAGLGRTAVAIVDKEARILPEEDDDVVEIVERQMEAEGVTIHHDSRLYDLQLWEDDTDNSLGGVQYTLMNRYTKELTTHHVDQALLAIGRWPNYNSLGLTNTSVKTRDGRLVANEFGLCENTKNIYVIGDAAAKNFRVCVAESMGKLAVEHMYSPRLQRPPIPFSITPKLGFFSLAIASVGLGEKGCREKNVAYIACKYGYDLVSRSVAATSTNGFIKILVSKEMPHYILGLRAVGLGSSTLVDLATLALHRRQTVYDLANRLTGYPALSQAFQECLHAILGTSVLKPGAFDSITLTEWTPDNYQRGVAFQETLRAEKDRKKSFND